MSPLMKLLLAFVALLAFIDGSQAAPRPYHDNSISGTILNPWGGALDNYVMFQAPTYSNQARYGGYYGGYPGYYRA